MTTRLVVLILIPAVVAGILAGLRVRDGVNEAGLYTRIERLATLSESVARLVQELQDERDLTVQYLTVPRDGQDQAVREQQSVTDRAARGVRGRLGGIDGEYSDQVRAKVRDVRYRLDSLAGLRQVAGQNSASAFSTLDIYGQLITSLLDLNDLVAQGSPNADVSESTRAFAALARAKDFASQERALTTSVLLTRRFANPSDRERLLALRSQQDGQMAIFRTTADTGQRQLLEDTVTGPDIGRVEGLYQQVLVRSGSSSTMSVRPLGPSDAATWRNASTSRIEQLRRVEENLAGSIRRDSEELKDGAYVGVAIDAALLLIGLLLAALATGAVARSLVRPLRRLQAGALEVAGTRLPGLVDRLRDPEAAADGIEVEPIDVDSSDEIGQVARAFDEVHREAVRLAADEAVLRGNINAMFVNLSRRSQSLIERQLRLIEELEQSERDEEQLANLFRLDHLATRMRRNCENLLVLGGQDQVRRWNRPVPLIDVVRASLSEVEQYERVALRVHGDMTVGGPVVNDLVHLLAELVENATVFSAEHTRVTVSGQLLSGGGAMLQITDNGVGMSQDELEQANWRLANPPVIDFSAARRMGLFVVGRLAVRHGIRVELRAAQGGGLTAFVVLPEMVISPSESGGVGSRGFGAMDEGAGRSGEFAAMAAPSGTVPSGPGGQFRPSGSGEYGVPRPRPGGAPAQPPGTGPQPVMGEDPRRPGGPRPPGYGATGPQPVYDGGPFEGAGFDDRPYEDRRFDDRPFDDRPFDDRPFDDRPFDDRPFDGPQMPSDARDLDPRGFDRRRFDARRPEDRAPGAPGPYENGTPYQNGTPYENAQFDRSPNTTGPLPAAGGHGTGPHPPVAGTGPMPVVPPAEQGEHEQGPPEERPGRRGPRLPVRRPGAQHPARGGTPADPAPPPAPGPGPAPGDPRQTGPLPVDPRQTGPLPVDPRQTGPLPVVPEAQPAVPGTGPLPRVPWETGPLPVVPEIAGQGPSDQAPHAQNPPGRPASERAPRHDQAPEHAPPHGTGHDPGHDPVHDAGPPEPGNAAPPGLRERSPIFDAMQSEWFQRRTDQTPSEDPVRGWESPADAGFQAAEAAREPVAGERTAAGLPKRVPGRNRVPGAVGSQRPSGRQAAQAPPAGQGGRPAAPVPAQSADTVRNRFASLQRGVRKGRTETRGPGGPGEGSGSANTGETPSPSEGENGGAR
ncbi:nitrate- and nitrite sensing domain-containing protein [Spirillospora sp. CA-255316]